jgi:hypothetical protein
MAHHASLVLSHQASCQFGPSLCPRLHCVSLYHAIQRIVNTSKQDAIISMVMGKALVSHLIGREVNFKLDPRVVLQHCHIGDLRRKSS